MCVYACAVFGVLDLGPLCVVSPSPAPHPQRVDSGFGKLVYARNFLNSLIPKMMRKSLTDPRVAEVIDLERLQKITTIGMVHMRAAVK